MYAMKIKSFSFAVAGAAFWRGLVIGMFGFTLLCAFAASAATERGASMSVSRGRLETVLAPERPAEALVRVKDRKIVDEAREIRSRPFRLEWKSHAYRAMEAGAEYVETGAVLGDAFDIPLHDS